MITTTYHISIALTDETVDEILTNLNNAFCNRKEFSEHNYAQPITYKEFISFDKLRMYLLQHLSKLDSNVLAEQVQDLIEAGEFNELTGVVATERGFPEVFENNDNYYICQLLGDDFGKFLRVNAYEEEPLEFITERVNEWIDRRYEANFHLKCLSMNIDGDARWDLLKKPKENEDESGRQDSQASSQLPS